MVRLETLRLKDGELVELVVIIDDAEISCSDIEVVRMAERKRELYPPKAHIMDYDLYLAELLQEDLGGDITAHEPQEYDEVMII